MAPLQSGLRCCFFNRIKQPSLWSKNLLTIKLFAKYLHRQNRLNLRKINVICYQLKYIWIVRNRQKNKQKNTLPPPLFYLQTQLHYFATTSSTLLPPVVQEEGEQELGSVPNRILSAAPRSFPLLQQDCPYKLLSLRKIRLGVTPSQASREPQLQRGEHLFPFLLCPCCPQGCFSHVFSPHISLPWGVFPFLQQIITGAPPMLGLGCRGPTVELARPSPLSCQALGSPGHPSQRPHAPSTKCVGFLWNCISTLSCSCLYHLHPWIHWVSLEVRWCAKGERA